MGRALGGGGGMPIGQAMKPTGQAFLNIRDMFDGGGAGRSGPQFQGAPISGLLNLLGVKPLGQGGAAGSGEPMNAMGRGPLAGGGPAAPSSGIPVPSAGDIETTTLPPPGGPAPSMDDLQGAGIGGVLAEARRRVPGFDYLPREAQASILRQIANGQSITMMNRGGR